MAIYYVDDGQNPGGGGNAGTSTDPYLKTSGLATAVALAGLTGGDTIYVRGLFMLDNVNTGGDRNDDRGAAGAIALAKAGALLTGAPITIIGLSRGSSWTETSTSMATLNAFDTGGTRATNCLTTTVAGYFLRNLTLKNADNANFRVTGAASVGEFIFMNCHAHDSVGGNGFGFLFPYIQTSSFVNCTATGNATGYGFAGLTCSHLFCVATGNRFGMGYTALSGMSYYSCISANNSRDQYQGGGRNAWYNCVAHGAGATYSGFLLNDGPNLIQGCRITNNAGYGINVSTGHALDMFNFFANNGGDTNGSTIYSLLNTANTQLTGTSAQYGYNNAAGLDFRTILGAIGYRNSFTIDANGNIATFPMGLPIMPLIPRGDI